MTVKEMIKHLEECNPDAELFIIVDKSDDYDMIKPEVDKNGNYCIARIDTCNYWE